MVFDTGPGFKSAEARERWNTYALSRAEAFEQEDLGAQAKSPETAYGPPQDAAGLALAAGGILTQQDDAVISSLGETTVPTLVLVREHDGPFLAGADYMASRIPGATKAVLSHAGPAANLDQPEQFNRVVGDFLRSL